MSNSSAASMTDTCAAIASICGSTISPHAVRRPSPGVYLNGMRRAGTLRFGGGSRSRSFDVTALLRDLERAGPVGDRLVVSLVPHGTPDPGAAPRLGGLSLVFA